MSNNLQNQIYLFNDILSNINDDENLSEAVITTFVFNEYNENQLKLLDTFIKSHEFYNKNSLIFIFTNLDNLEHEYSARVRFVKVPYLDENIMSYRIALNYSIFHKFKNFKILYIFDTDLIAINNYENLVNFEFDVGLTLCNNWFNINKFPINAGFLIINNRAKSNAINFAEKYLKSYKLVIKNQSSILKNSKIKHEKIDLEKWWGDQYLFFYLLNKFPNNIKDSHIYEENNIKYMFYNEDKYNFQSVELKYANKSFDLKKYLNQCKTSKYFLHLTGRRKKYINDIGEYLFN